MNSGHSLLHPKTMVDVSHCTSSETFVHVIEVTGIFRSTPDVCKFGKDYLSCANVEIMNFILYNHSETLGMYETPIHSLLMCGSGLLCACRPNWSFLLMCVVKQSINQ